MTLNNFVLTQTRAVRSIQEQCNILKQQRRLLQLEQVRLQQENMAMKQIGATPSTMTRCKTDSSLVQQIPVAAEQLSHPHRFSLPGNYVFGAQPHMFTAP